MKKLKLLLIILASTFPLIKATEKQKRELIRAFCLKDFEKFSNILKKKLKYLKSKKISSKDFMKSINEEAHPTNKRSIYYFVASDDKDGTYETQLTKTMILALKNGLITEQNFKNFIIYDKNAQEHPIFFTHRTIDRVNTLLNLFLEKDLSKKIILEILNTKIDDSTAIATAVEELPAWTNSPAILAYLLPRLFDIAIDMKDVDLKKLPENETCPWIKQLAKTIASKPDNKEPVQKIHNDIKSMIIKADKKSKYMPHIKKLIEKSWE